MALDSIDLTPRVGSEIRIGREALLGGGQGRGIRELLEQRGVVIVRDMPITDDELHTIAASLGDIRIDGKDGGTKASLLKVTFDKEHNAELAEYFLGTFSWHFDGAWENVPPLGSVLTPRVLAPTGGETEFVNTYAAYDDLPDDKKRQFDTLKVAHTMVETYSRITPDPTPEQIADWRGYGEKIHPLVWHHRSGRKSIALSNSAEYIVGMDREEGRALIKWLGEWCEQPRFVYRHEWRMDDVLIWDNTGTMHRAAPYDIECGRRLHRVTLVGEESLEPVREAVA